MPRPSPGLERNLRRARATGLERNPRLNRAPSLERNLHLAQAPGLERNQHLDRAPSLERNLRLARAPALGAINASPEPWPRRQASNTRWPYLSHDVCHAFHAAAGHVTHYSTNSYHSSASPLSL